MDHFGTTRLETGRLILRRFTRDDVQSVFSNWVSDDEVTRYLIWPIHRTVDDSRRYMDFCVYGYSNPASYQWGMERKDTGEMVGPIFPPGIRE